MRLNPEYRTALKGGKWRSKIEREWLRGQIEDEMVEGLVAGSCFLVILTMALLIALGVML